MKINFKTILLAGTTCAAIAGFSGAARAQALDLDASDTWADGGAGPLGGATTGDDVDASADGVTMTVINDGVNDDGGGTDDFEIGAYTDSSTAQDASLLVTVGTANNMTASFDSIVIGGDADFVIDDGLDGDLLAGVSDASSIGGDLNIENAEATNAHDLVVIFADNIAIDGSTTLLSDDGGGAGSDTAAVFRGSTVVFTGGLTMEENGAGQVLLVFDGSDIQDISGEIDGATAAEGDIFIANNSVGGVVFEDEIGRVNGVNSITLDDTSDVTATFFDNVTATNIIVGLGNGNTATAIFNTSGGDITVSGDLDGDAGSTSDVSVIGSNTLITDSDWGGGTPLNTVTIGGTASLELHGDLTADVVNVGSGADITTAFGTVTAASGITLTGTGSLTMDGGAVTADVDGSAANRGILNVNSTGVLTGNIGAGSSLSQINIATGAALTATGDVIATTTTLTGTGEIDVTTGNEFQTNVIAAVDGDGAIVFSDTTATTDIAGSIGTSSASVGSLSITDGANDAVLTAAGDLYVDAIALGTNDTLQFLGDGVTQVVSGTIDGNGANGIGDLIIGDGATATTVEFNDSIGNAFTLNDFTVNTLASAEFVNSDAIFAGALDNDGTIILHAGNSLTVDSYDSTADADPGSWRFGVDRTAGVTTSATIATTGAAGPDFSADTVDIYFEAGSQIIGAQTIASAIVGGGAGTQTFLTVNDASFLYTFDFVPNGNDLDLVISTAGSVNGGAFNVSNRNVGNVLVTDLVNSVDPEINLVQGNLQNADDPIEFNQVLDSAAATINGADVAASLNVASTAIRVADTRMAALRYGGDYYSGVSSGNSGTGLRWWGQGLAQSAVQDTKDNVPGYQADSWGWATGVDTENMSDDGVLGAAFSYGFTSANSSDMDTTDTIVRNYQLTMYGEYDVTSATYMNAMLAYAWNDIHTARHNVGLAGLTASGKYNASQVTARAEIGHDIYFGNTTLTPDVMAHWTHWMADSYTEKGAGGLNETIDSKDIDVVDLGGGVQAMWDLKGDDGSHFVPKMRLEGRYDVIGDKVQASSQFVGGGPAFTLEGPSVDPLSLDAGGSLSYYSADNWEMTADYNYRFKQDYTAHTLFLRLAYKL